jgi:hypothetical protein
MCGGTCQPMNTGMHYSVIDLHGIQAEEHTTTVGHIKKTQVLLCHHDPCHVAAWEVPCHAWLNQAPTVWVPLPIRLLGDGYDMCLGLPPEPTTLPKRPPTFTCSANHNGVWVRHVPQGPWRPWRARDTPHVWSAHTMVCQGVCRVRELSSLKDETCMTVPITHTMLVVRPNCLRHGTSAALWAHTWVMPTTFDGNIHPQHAGDDVAWLLG